MDIKPEKTTERIAEMTEKVKKVELAYFERLQELKLIDFTKLKYVAPSTPKDGMVLAAALKRVNVSAFVTGGLSLAIGGYQAENISDPKSELFSRELTYDNKVTTMGALIDALKIVKGKGDNTSRLNDDALTLGRWCNLVAPIAKVYLMDHPTVASSMFRKRYHAFYEDAILSGIKAAKPDDMRTCMFNGCERIIKYSTGEESECQSFLKFLKWNDEQVTPHTKFAMSARRYFMASVSKFDEDGIIVKSLELGKPAT